MGSPYGPGNMMVRCVPQRVQVPKISGFLAPKPIPLRVFWDQSLEILGTWTLWIDVCVRVFTCKDVFVRAGRLGNRVACRWHAPHG